MKKIKQFWAFFLVVAILSSAFSFTALAEEDADAADDEIPVLDFSDEEIAAAAEQAEGAEEDPAAESSDEAEGFEDGIHPMFEERMPLAIMLNNHVEARPQSGLTTADLIYEILTEGGITRYLLLTDAEEGTVGPIRSARPAFFDLVAEWQAVYSHVGNYEYVEVSPLAPYIKDMDAFFYGGGAYYRTSHRYAPHNLYGDIAGLYEAAENQMGWDLELDEPLDQLLVADEDVDRTEYETLEGVQDAKNVQFSYSSNLLGVQSASSHGYRYNEKEDAYEKLTDNTVLTEEQTGETVYVKNVIFMRLPHILMPNGVHWSIAYTSQKDDQRAHPS